MKCGTSLWELRRRPLGNPFLIEPWHGTGSTPGLRAGLQGEGHCQRGLPARCRPVFIPQKSSQRLSAQLVGEPPEMDFQQDHNIERSFFILRRLPKIFCLCFYSLLFYIATKKIKYRFLQPHNNALHHRTNSHLTRCLRTGHLVLKASPLPQVRDTGHCLPHWLLCMAVRHRTHRT